MSNYNIISKFVEVYILQQKNELRSLLHTNGTFLNLNKSKGTNKLIKLSKHDSKELVYCRFSISKCTNQSHSFTHSIKILYIEKSIVNDLTNPTFKPKHNPCDGEHLRYFWFKLEGDKIFEVVSIPN